MLSYAIFFHCVCVMVNDGSTIPWERVRDPRSRNGTNHWSHRCIPTRLNETTTHTQTFDPLLSDIRMVVLRVLVRVLYTTTTTKNLGKTIGPMGRSRIGKFNNKCLLVVQAGK